jgi:thioredoxin-related protein
MAYLFFAPFLIILLFLISVFFSALSGGTIPFYIFFFAFIGVSIWGGIYKSRKKKEVVIENKPIEELKITDTEEECPTCHKMSQKKFNACEYCATYKR